MKNCPRCGLDLAAPELRVGDVLLRVENGTLYRVTETYRQQEGGYYGSAERCWPPYEQAEFGFKVAVWPDHMKGGHWHRVETPLDKAAPCASDPGENR